MHWANVNGCFKARLRFIFEKISSTKISIQHLLQRAILYTKSPRIPCEKGQLNKQVYFHAPQLQRVRPKKCRLKLQGTGQLKFKISIQGYDSRWWQGGQENKFYQGGFYVASWRVIHLCFCPYFFILVYVWARAPGQITSSFGWAPPSHASFTSRSSCPHPMTRGEPAVTYEAIEFEK